MSIHRAPVDGIEINGKFYSGGEFIPGEEWASHKHEELKAAGKHHTPLRPPRDFPSGTVFIEIRRPDYDGEMRNYGSIGWTGKEWVFDADIPANTRRLKSIIRDKFPPSSNPVDFLKYLSEEYHRGTHHQASGLMQVN